MALLDDYQFNPTTFSPGAAPWQVSPQQAWAAFSTPQSLPSEPAFDVNYYKQGDVNVPIFGQPPSPAEVSAQQRTAPAQGSLYTTLMGQQPMQQPPAAASAPPTAEDRWRAAVEGFTNNRGLIPAIGAAIDGYRDGNVAVRALRARGIDETTAKAAARDPRIMAAVVQQAFGTRSGVNINNRLVDPTTGRLIADYSDTAKPVTLGNDQRLVNPQTGRVLVGPAQVASMDNISGIRKEISGLPEVKRYGEAAPIFRSMVESQSRDTAAADLDFVYGIAKIFDPESVVREGEMRLVGQAQSLPEDVKGFIKRVAMGEGRLTPDARYRILEVANTRMGELRGAYDTRLAPFGGIADRANINRADVMPAMVDLPKLGPKPSELPRPATVADAMKLKPGTRFIGPDGRERIR